jgi:hypothetical protein
VTLNCACESLYRVRCFRELVIVIVIGGEVGVRSCRELVIVIGVEIVVRTDHPSRANKQGNW